MYVRMKEKCWSYINAMRALTENVRPITLLLKELNNAVNIKGWRQFCVHP